MTLDMTSAMEPVVPLAESDALPLVKPPVVPVVPVEVGVPLVDVTEPALVEPPDCVLLPVRFELEVLPLLVSFDCVPACFVESVISWPRVRLALPVILFTLRL